MKSDGGDVVKGEDYEFGFYIDVGNPSVTSFEYDFALMVNGVSGVVNQQIVSGQSIAVSTLTVDDI